MVICTTGVQRRLKPLLTFTSLNGKRILDLGCGSGIYSKEMIRLGAECVVALDIKPNGLKTLNSNINKIQASALNLPLRRDCFDIIIIFEVLEHVSCDDAALKEAKRVLKNSGVTVITAPNKFYPWDTHGIKQIKRVPFMSWLPNFLRRKMENARIYTSKQMQNKLVKQGFQIFKVDYMMPCLDSLSNTNLKFALRKFLSKVEATWLRHFGLSIIIVAS